MIATTGGKAAVAAGGASPRNCGLGPIAVTQPSTRRRCQRPVSEVLLTYPVSALGRKRRDQSSDCCSRRRTHASDPKRKSA
jgi:hypothetical protein